MHLSPISEKGSKKEYKVEFEPAKLHQIINEKLEKIKNQTKIPGFRPGKVPLDIVKKHYAQSIEQEELPKFIQNEIDNYFTKNNIRIMGSPEMKNLVFNEKELSLEFAYYEMPEIKEPDYQSINLKKFVSKAEQNLIDDNLKMLAEKNKKFQTKNNKSILGDMVVINFLGKINNVPFEGGKAENFQLILGSNHFIDNFEEQLIGKKAGDEVLVQVTFPKNYHSPNLAGKKAEFEVQINEVKEAVETEIDDDLAVRLNFASLDELTQKLSEQLEENLNQISESYLKKDLFDILEKKYDIELPPSLIEQEFNLLWKNTPSRNEYTDHIHDENCNHSSEEKSQENEVIAKEDENLKEYYRDIAKRRLKLGVILAEIGRKNNIELTSDEIKEAAFKYANQYPGREHEILNQLRKNPNALGQLKSSLLEEKVVTFIMKSLNIEEENIKSDILLELTKELK